MSQPNRPSLPMRPCSPPSCGLRSGTAASSTRWCTTSRSCCRPAWRCCCARPSCSTLTTCAGFWFKPFAKLVFAAENLQNAYQLRLPRSCPAGHLVPSNLRPPLLPPRPHAPQKRAHFRTQVKESEAQHYGTLRLHVRREHVFEVRSAGLYIHEMVAGCVASVHYTARCACTCGASTCSGCGLVVRFC